MSIILSPPGSGKTTWLKDKNKNNKNKNFNILDADIVLKDFHTIEYESSNPCETHRKDHYLTIDKQLLNLRKEGIHILGSLFWEVKADVIVIIDSIEHQKRVSKRDDLEWCKVELVTKCLQELALKYNIPIVSSFDAIFNYI
jgi:Ni2+-binding GTPase involved in maturation of urease and hydrogenase